MDHNGYLTLSNSIEPFMITLTPAFIANIQDIYGEAGRAWLKELPYRLQQLSALWGFELMAPMPNLSCNFVGLVKREPSDEMAILKLAPEGGNLATEMRWLKYIGKSVPEIYESDETLNACLMERLTPGHSLKKRVEAGDDDGATRIICQMVRTIQSTPCRRAGFPHLCELARAFSLLEGKMEPALLSKARGLFTDLTTDRTKDVLLHGDLHHDNILASDSHWKIIDPHGYVGDPAAETGAMIRNALDGFPDAALPKVVERRLQVMADNLPFDALKIKSWSFCATLLSAAWSLEDHGTLPKRMLRIATAIDQAQV